MDNNETFLACFVIFDDFFKIIFISSQTIKVARSIKLASTQPIPLSNNDRRYNKIWADLFDKAFYGTL